MKKVDKAARVLGISEGLRKYAENRDPAGLQDNRIEVFAKQLFDSMRRIEYVRVVSQAESDVSSLNVDAGFNPLKAAAYYKQEGNLEEAFWLIFLAIYCGKNHRTGWGLVSELYAGGDSISWTWARINSDFEGYKQWFEDSYKKISGKFGNHRKYETLKPSSRRGTLSVFQEYIRWIEEVGSHSDLFKSEVRDFDAMYKELKRIPSFGRTTKFDYLSMIVNFGLYDAYPRKPYIQGSTGPLRGMKLLMRNNLNANIASSICEREAIELAGFLNLGDMQMQVIEDAICNWQKSPARYIRFNG